MNYETNKVNEHHCTFNLANESNNEKWNKNSITRWKEREEPDDKTSVKTLSPDKIYNLKYVFRACTLLTLEWKANKIKIGRKLHKQPVRFNHFVVFGGGQSNSQSRNMENIYEVYLLATKIIFSMFYGVTKFYFSEEWKIFQRQSCSCIVGVLYEFKYIHKVYGNWSLHFPPKIFGRYRQKSFPFLFVFPSLRLSFE